MVVGSGRRARGQQRWGHHHAERWTLLDRPDRQAELFIAGELPPLGAERILQTILHEAAHGLAAARGINDRSRSGNRYHNGRFAQLAIEVRLQPPVKPSSSLGYSDCAITPDTAAAYAASIASLDAAVTAYLDDSQSQMVRGPREGRRFAVECDCGRRLQVSPRSYEDGPIICGKCGSRFQRN